MLLLYTELKIILTVECNMQLSILTHQRYVSRLCRVLRLYEVTNMNAFVRVINSGA